MNFSSDHSWSIQIGKLMQWRSGTWSSYCSRVTTNNLLVIHYDQMFITNREKVLETFSFNGRIKGFFKENIMILVINDTTQGIRKIKFQIMFNASECIEKFRAHFPVLSYNSVKSNNDVSPRFSNLENIIKHAIDGKDDNGTASVPPNFSSFVKLCLLDPCFPHFINETQKVIDSLVNKPN